MNAAEQDEDAAEEEKEEDQQEEEDEPDEQEEDLSELTEQLEALSVTTALTQARRFGPPTKGAKGTPKGNKPSNSSLAQKNAASICRN